MKELSIFVDESGDLGEYDYRAPYYIISMVFHDQNYDMNKELEILKLQNRIVLLQGRTEKDNKNVQRKCLRKLKKIQE